MNRAWPLAAAVLAATTVLTGGSSALVCEPAPAVPRIAMPPAPRHQSTPTPTPTPTFANSRRAALTRALRDYLDDRSGSLSISVRDLSTGLAYSYGKTLRTATASIVKVDIVMALLLKAQRQGRSLTSTEKALAKNAIEVSDNAAATTLWHAIGGSAGLASANRKLGLRDTDPGPGDAWGSTMTSAADQVRLLTALTSSKSPLRSSARRYVRHLMGEVVSEQAWGVSAAGGEAEIKNGWLPREIHGGRWTVNSIGIVRDDDHLYQIAAISERNPTMETGITAIEHAAKAITRAMAPPSAAER